MDSFSARRSGNQTAGTTCIFGTTSNWGAHPSAAGDIVYDAATGIATVQTAGVYQFVAYVEILLGASSIPGASMLLNNDAGRPLATLEQPANYPTQTNYGIVLDSGFVVLAANDTVHVNPRQALAANYAMVGGDATGGGSRFSGVYLGSAPGG